MEIRRGGGGEFPLPDCLDNCTDQIIWIFLSAFIRRRGQLDYWVAPPIYLGPAIYVGSH